MSEHFVNLSILPSQLRAARALLGWSQRELADHAGVGLGTIRNFEAGVTTPIANNLKAILKALDDAGIEFIDATDTKGVGVRLVDPPR